MLRAFNLLVETSDHKTPDKVLDSRSNPKIVLECFFCSNVQRARAAQVHDDIFPCSAPYTGGERWVDDLETTGSSGVRGGVENVTKIDRHYQHWCSLPVQSLPTEPSPRRVWQMPYAIQSLRPVRVAYLLYLMATISKSMTRRDVHFCRSIAVADDDADSTRARCKARRVELHARKPPRQSCKGSSLSITSISMGLSLNLRILAALRRGAQHVRGSQ